MGNCFSVFSEMAAGGAMHGNSKGQLLPQNETEDLAINNLEGRLEVVDAIIAELYTQRAAITRDTASARAPGAKRMDMLKRLVVRKRVNDKEIAQAEQQRTNLMATAAQLRGLCSSVETSRVIYEAQSTMRRAMPEKNHAAVIDGAERAGEAFNQDIEFVKELGEVTARSTGVTEGGDAYSRLMNQGVGATAEETENAMLRELGLLGDEGVVAVERSDDDVETMPSRPASVTLGYARMRTLPAVNDEADDGLLLHTAGIHAAM